MDRYSKQEERYNIISHALALIMSVLATILLLLKAAEINDLYYWMGVSVFGVSLILLYAASTMYHGARLGTPRRKRLKVFDHAAIYVLIAGTATPFMTNTLHASTGNFYLVIMWCVALFGIVFKLFFTGRFKLISTLSYIAQGWIVLLAFFPVWGELPSGLTNFVVLGGVAYTLGAVLYMIKRIPYNHFIFHILCIFGSAFHFYAIYQFV